MRTHALLAQFPLTLAMCQVRNDAIADTLDLARRRIKKLEDQRQEAELKVELTEVSGWVGSSLAQWMLHIGYSDTILVYQSKG